MEQSETPQDPPTPPDAPGKKPQLPDPKGAFAVPESFRMPFFHGKMVTPTAAPSATERQANLRTQEGRRRRRGFLVGLLVGQLLIIALDVGGMLFLRSQPQVRLRAPIGVPSIVFLGMAAGAAVVLVAVALIYGVLALRGLFGRKSRGILAAAGSGIKRLVTTTLALGVSIGVIIGTAWFMIPQPEWKPTTDYAKARGLEAFDASKAKVRSILAPGPRGQ